MLELEAARKRVLFAVAPLPAESVPLAAGHGRVVARTLTAAFDLPLFDNSSMDGFAVRSEDLRSARLDSPVVLCLIGEVAAGGDPSSVSVSPGECVRVSTGSALPSGVNAVVMQEDARQLPGKPAHVQFLNRVDAWENIRRRGEDVKRSDGVLAPGDRLTPASLALLAALGVRELQVSRRPIVALLSTGSELVEPGRELRPGQIYESNRAALIPLMARTGAISSASPPVRDTLADTRAALEKAFAECDAVVTTGGVSVGEMDFVKSAFEAMGGVLEFWKVAMKPGKPFVFGRFGRKFLFGLPGNPVSSIVTFLLLVHPALRKMQGATDVDLPAHPGTLVESLSNPGDRRHFMRVTVNARGEVCSAGEQGSHRLSSMARANGLVDVPPNTILPIGTQVSVLRLD
jgi:molybdenum cofactor synthesis domain-containing protein